MKKRFLAVLLMMAMLFSVLPASALAAEGGEDSEAPVVCAGYGADETCGAETHVEGCPLYVAPVDGGKPTSETVEDEDSWAECTSCSADDPHLIYTTADLDKIRTHTQTTEANGNQTTVTGYFRLANDITFEASDFEDNGDFYHDGEGWISIGKVVEGNETTVNAFVGIFDGNNHTISNLWTANQTTNVGLFAQVGDSSHTNATVENLVIKNAILNEIPTGDTQNGRPTGCIAGDLYGKVSNITIDGCKLYSVKGNVGAVVAGLVGGTIENCTVVNSEVYGIATSTGGNNNGDKCGLICGYANDNAQITNCVVKDSKVMADSRGAAGIAGMQYGSTIKDCTVSNCEITGKGECVGGISGGNYAGNWESSIENCVVSDCKISGATNVGGIEGNINGGTITVTLKNNTIQNCNLFLTGEGINGANAGGILAAVSSTVTATIENCVAHNVTIDSRDCTLMENGSWPVRLGSICGGGATSLDISNVFADVEILYSENQSTRIGGICTDQGSISQSEAIRLVKNPSNTYYVQYNNVPANDVPFLEKSNYGIKVEDKAFEYGSEISLKDIFGVLGENAENITYQSSNSDVLTISNGEITVQNVGNTTIASCVPINGVEQSFVSANITVTPRVLTYVNKGNQTNPGSVTYPVSDDYTDVNDVLTFKWKDDPNTVVTLQAGEDINYTYSISAENGGSGVEGTVDFLPVPAGTYEGVKFNLINPNYVFANSTEGGDPLTTISFTVNVAAEGVSRAYLANLKSTGSATFTYDGEGKLPVSGTLTAYKENSTTAETVEEMTFNVHIEGLNDTVFHSFVEDVPSGTDVTAISGLVLPTKPGAYVLTVSAENGSYYVYKSQVITITKATITIKADDKSVYAGGTMPELTYTVTGLASGENLSGEVGLTCDAADTNTEGTYTITPSGGAVPSADCYNEIVYETGTLTVSSRPSGGGGGGATTYTVTVDSAKNGTVTVSPKSASKGTTVTITVKPDSGYELDDLTVTDKNGDTVKLTRKSDTQYTFTMPASKVTVEASFTEIEEQPAVSFVDVSASAYYYDAVAWAVENGVTSGTSATTFSPDAACTRAQAVTFLWRAAGSPAPKSSVNPFADVSTSAYYYDAVLWAVEQGITVGTSATTFSPDLTCTRAQIVTFLYRADGTATAGNNPFTDVADSAYYAGAVKWAVAEGVTAGTSATTFSPDASCTRAQIVTFLYRAYA